MGNLPEFYFENEFPADSKFDESSTAQKPDDEEATVVDHEDDVFDNAESGVVADDVDDDDENVEKAIDEKDFDK